MLIDNSVFYFNPTGYKAEKVYSVFPTNGDGDFSFDRNSIKTRVAKNGFVTEVGSDIPSISFDTISGVTNSCGHWQVESQSTNLITYSDDFSQSEWTKGNATITSNTVISPDGTKNASTLTDNTANTIHRLRDSVSLSASTDYSLSVFAKKGTLSNIQLALINTANSNTSSRVFDLENGVLGEEITSGGTLTDSKITDFGNGWYRCQIVAQLNSTPNTYQVTLASQSSGNTSTGSQVTYEGDGNGNVYLWGAQLEQKSYVSSYISTSGSSVTRLAEGGFESDYSSSTTFPANTTTFVLWFSVKGKDGTFYDMIRFGDSSSGDYLRLEPITTSNYYNIYGDNITASGLINGNFEVQPNTICKLAVSYDTSEVKCYINGSSVTLNATSGNLNIVDKIYNSTGNMNNINIHRLVVFNEKLSNSNLVTLTS